MKDLNEVKAAVEKMLSASTELQGSVLKQSSDMSAQLAEFSKKNGELEENLSKILESNAALETKLVELEKCIVKPKTGVSSLPGVEDEKQKFSFSNAFYAIASGDWKNAGFEAEVFKNTSPDAVSTRVMGTSPASAGGYIVPVQVATEIIELLRAQTVVDQMGATVLLGLNEIIQLPKQSGGATAYWVTENVDDITETDVSVGMLEMRPRNIACLSTFSRVLMKMSNPSIESMLRADFTKAISLEVDYAAMFGSGVEGEPKGIANFTGINTHAMGTDGGFWDFTAAKEMEGELEDDNALTGSLGYVMHPKVKRKLQTYRIAQFSGDTEGPWLTLPMSNAMLERNLDYKFKTSTQILTTATKGDGTNLSSVIFGNWMELLIGYWGGIEIDASMHAGDSFKKNQIQLRANLLMDTGVRHAESFCLCSDAETV